MYHGRWIAYTRTKILKNKFRFFTWLDNTTILTSRCNGSVETHSLKRLVFVFSPGYPFRRATRSIVRYNNSVNNGHEKKRNLHSLLGTMYETNIYVMYIMSSWGDKWINGRETTIARPKTNLTIQHVDRFPVYQFCCEYKRQHMTTRLRKEITCKNWC